MIIQPKIFTHPKFMRLNRITDDRAMTYLCRIWAHCQDVIKSENLGKVDADWVEALCDWKGNPGMLWDALIHKIGNMSGWLEIDSEGNVLAHDWYENNKQLKTLVGMANPDMPSNICRRIALIQWAKQQPQHMLLSAMMHCRFLALDDLPDYEASLVDELYARLMMKKHDRAVPELTTASRN